MSSYAWKRIRPVAFSVTSAIVALSLTLTCATPVDAEPSPTSTTSSSTSSPRSPQDMFGTSTANPDGSTVDKRGRASKRTTVTSINHLKDFFAPPKESITTPEPDDENALLEGRDLLRNEKGEVVPTGKHTEQSAAEAQGLYCETSDDLTFGGIAHLVEDEMRKLIKDETSMKVFNKQVQLFEQAMDLVQLPSIVVSNPSTQLTGPAREINDHGVNYVVASLLKARDGGWRSTVAVQDLTINEAIETVLLWFYWVNIYGSWYNDTFPAIVQFNVLGIFKWGLTDPYEKTLSIGPGVVNALGNFIQKQLQNNCLVKKNSRSNPGNYKYHEIPEWMPEDITKGVHQLEEPIDNIEVADEDCPPISEMNYRRIGKRTVIQMREMVKPQYRQLFDQSAQFVLQRMEEIKVNKGLIPLKSKDIGGVIGMINNPTVTYIYTIGTSPFDGRVFEWVPMGEITVDNTFDIAIVAHRIARVIANIMYSIFKAIVNAIVNATNDSIDKAIRKAIVRAATGQVIDATSEVCKAAMTAAIAGSVANPAPGPEDAAAPPAAVTLAACGFASWATDKAEGDQTQYVPEPVFKFRIWPLPALDFGIIIPWFGSIPLSPTADADGAHNLGDVPVFGGLFDKSKYLKLLTIFGLEYDLWINPIPTLFFVGDNLAPIAQGVTQSVCLAEDKGHRSAQWKRDSAQIAEDADLGEKKGVYEAPKGKNVVLFNKWVLPFKNPFFKPDYANLNEDVPEREPMIQRHNPDMMPAPIDPDDAEYREYMEKTPTYVITYNRDPDQLPQKSTVTETPLEPEATASSTATAVPATEH